LTGWKEEQLTGKRNGDNVQVALTGGLRQERTMKRERHRPAAAKGQLDPCLKPVL